MSKLHSPASVWFYLDVLLVMINRSSSLNCRRSSQVLLARTELFHQQVSQSLVKEKERIQTKGNVWSDKYRTMYNYKKKQLKGYEVQTPIQVEAQKYFH